MGIHLAARRAVGARDRLYHSCVQTFYAAQIDPWPRGHSLFTEKFQVKSLPRRR